jgi:UDP-N-acetyl-D-galactosamine dehydrogenase
MNNRKISVIGLGYVGLPVAVAFGQRGRVIGFDINSVRINELKSGLDHTGAVTLEDLRSAKIFYTVNADDLISADLHIIAVPTPVDKANQPDLTPLELASETVGGILKKGDIVVYESTVFPGATEEVCVPILENVSGLKAGIEFKVGYSPERINPGDSERTFTKIKKIVSGQDCESLGIIAEAYGSVVEAGIYCATSIRVAEAAKVIENTQRDLNIALMNELAIIFEKMDISTGDVLAAAGTKWNFLKFTPGLVGGHCIGVDPYYLTYKAEQLGYNPQVILAGRQINDGMGKFISQIAVKKMIHAGQNILGSRALILGVTFKENCPDTRNSKVIDLFEELSDFGIVCDVYDPRANPAEVAHEYGIQLSSWASVSKGAYDVIIAAVAHDEFRLISNDQLKNLSKPNGVIIDIKGLFDSVQLADQSMRYWRL